MEHDSETDRLARAFLSRTLPRAEWTHEAHLRVGLWHVLRYGSEAALEQLRRGIQEYNLASGVVNTDTGGYHETITRCYVLVISGFLRDRDRGTPIDDLARTCVERYGARDLLLRHYTRDRLMSTTARREWVEPDLLPIAEAAGS